MKREREMGVYLAMCCNTFLLLGNEVEGGKGVSKVEKKKGDECDTEKLVDEAGPEKIWITYVYNKLKVVTNG